jgi:hypothetical protein
MLYSFFLVLPVPTSRFRAPVLAQMTGGLPHSASFCASAPPCRPCHLLRPCHTLFTIYYLRWRQDLRQPRFLVLRFSAVLYSHAEHPVSEYCMLFPAKNAGVSSLPVSFDFSVIFLHIISLIHRHLALYHSQVAFFDLF